MPASQRPTPFEQIDQDPHFARVVRYFRPSDYGVWAAGTIAFPALLYGFERVSPTTGRTGWKIPRPIIPALKVGTFLGICGGFLIAYQRSSLRFWGWTENEREVEMDKKEMEAKIAAGEPMFGKTDLPEHIQGIASRNSKYSALKLSAIPWFNVVNHGPKTHGVEPEKYGSTMEKEYETQKY